jgi:hypothetical protein
MSIMDTQRWLCIAQVRKAGLPGKRSLSEVLDGEISLLLANQFAVLLPILNETLRKNTDGTIGDAHQTA